METAGRVAVITGGASGIGRGMARAFADAGMKLLLADLDDAMLAATVDELAARGVEVAGQRCDVSKLEDVEALAAAALDRFGAVHVLCNNAGIGIPTPTQNIRIEDWRWIIDVDLWGPIYGVKTFLPIMEAQGDACHINTTASLAGLIGGSYMGAYNVAKHGAVALMTTLERDLRGRKSPVHASVLCPGPINTDISRHSVTYRPSKAKPKSDSAADGRAAASVQAQLDKGMDPDDVGRLVLDGIPRDTFWLLTHPNFSKVLTRQLDALMADGSVTKAGPAGPGRLRRPRFVRDPWASTTDRSHGRAVSPRRACGDRAGRPPRPPPRPTARRPPSRRRPARRPVRPRARPGSRRWRPRPRRAPPAPPG